VCEGTPSQRESVVGWDLLLSAQSNPLRVPTALLEEKKREMKEREQQEALRRRFRFEKPGQEDLHVFGVDDLCVRVHLVSERAS
jgi:hypothetical protein